MKRVIIEFNGDDDVAIELLESNGYRIIHVATHQNTKADSIVQAWRNSSEEIKEVTTRLRELRQDRMRLSDYDHIPDHDDF